MGIRIPLAVAIVVVLAGCNGVLGPTGSTSTPPNGTEAAPADEPTATPAGGTSPDGTAGTTPDPPADRLGWENGYWYNESIDVDDTDGLNERELAAVLGRSMARVERIREREFDGDVSVETVSEEEFVERLRSGESEDLRTFRNVTYEAAFLVGTGEDATEVYWETYRGAVRAFYRSDTDTVLIVGGSGAIRFASENVLAHELVHALQDQRWNLTELSSNLTADRFTARSGLVEGGASLVQLRYRARCTGEWECIDGATASGGGGGGHPGVLLHVSFRYQQGLAFVYSLYQRGGWAPVDAAFENPPESSEQLIYRGKYGEDEPVTVTLEDTHGGSWERVRPAPRHQAPNRPVYETMGQSTLSTMFAYTALAGRDASEDRNRSSVVERSTFVRHAGRQNPGASAYDLGLNYTDGWEGDRLHAYERDGETAYVWRIVWENESEASEFLHGYRRLLRYWGGERLAGGTWRIAEDSPFTGAIYVERRGDTVTLVKAPTTDDLAAVYGGYGG